MNDLTNNQIDQLLAPLCGRDAHYFRPATDRNDLADVLGKLTPEQWIKAIERINDIWFRTSTDSPGHGSVWWLMTCDPSIIARAVAEVVR